MSFRETLSRTTARVAAGLMAVAALASCGGGTYQVNEFVPARILSFGDENGGTFLDVGCDGTWRGDHEELSPIDVRIWLDGNGVGVPLTRTRALELRELLLQAAQFMSMAETLD